MPDLRLPFNHSPVTGTKLYCLVTDVCEQLAQGRYPNTEQLQVETATLESQVERSRTITALGHTQ